VLVSWHLCEHLAEIWRADRENEAVSFDELAFCGERNIDEISSAQRLVKAGREVCVEVVPTQGELFFVRHFRTIFCLWFASG
jgi:hypothetical protein